MNQCYALFSASVLTLFSNSRRSGWYFYINLTTHQASKERQCMQSQRISSPALMSLRAYEVTSRQSLEAGKLIQLLGFMEQLVNSIPPPKTRSPPLSFRQMPHCSILQSSSGSVIAYNSYLEQTIHSLPQKPLTGTEFSLWQIQYTAPLGISSSANRPLPPIGLSRIQTEQKNGIFLMLMQFYYNCKIEKKPFRSD